MFQRRVQNAKERIFSVIISGSFLVLPSSANAQMSQLGVVRSGENQGQWSGITARLRASGVAYCVVDLQQLKSAANLAGTQVLFLPNVETLSDVEVGTLQDWMDKGGRTIVSGPTGTLSSPNVRSALRSLFGAYWGFAIATPTNLQPNTAKTIEWVKADGLAGSGIGGAVIPTALASQTAAVWKSDINSNAPAVVATDKSVFFGWRWGVDTGLPAEVDSAWLKAALGRYGQAGLISSVPPTGPEQPCRSAAVATQKTEAARPSTIRANRVLSSRAISNAPATVRSAGANQSPKNQAIRPGWLELPNAIALDRLKTPGIPLVQASDRPSTSPLTVENTRPGEQRVISQAPVPIQSSRAAQLADQQVTPTEVETLRSTIPPITTLAQRSLVQSVPAMRQDLENLIGRVESAFITANAQTSTEDKGLRNWQTSSASPQSSVISKVPATEAARAGLQNFIDLVAVQNYSGAREQWTQLRRSLLQQYPTNRKIAQPEIRAMWLDRGTIVSAGSPKALARIFDSMAAAGINTVFFETVNAGYPIYPSRIAPKQNPMVRGWDPLEAAVKLAHERGMELHAWVWVFAAANRVHNRLLNLPDTYPGPLVEAHPDWAASDKQGRIFDPRSGKVFLDPANPEVRRYLLDLIGEIAIKYKVDGVQLDYIRYPFQEPSLNQTYGYGKAARQQFKQLTGRDPIAITASQADLWDSWTQFRISQIDSFVTEVSQRLRSQRSDIILSAAVFPMPKQERLSKLQQNWETWALRGDIDMLVPMTYVLEANQLQHMARPLFNESALAATLILPSVRLLNLPDVVAFDQIQLLRDLPAGGYALFAYENFNGNLQGIFNRTQGKPEKGSNFANLCPASSDSQEICPTTEAIPYRQPFQAAASRYAVLQAEWSYLKTNNQIWIKEPALSQWGKEALELSEALNQLAREPSREKFAYATAAMRSFRSEFRKWMQLQAIQQPYQVQMWENRLATVERLLKYGERSRLTRGAKK